MKSSTVSHTATVTSQRRRVAAIATPRRPPIAAHARNAHKEVRERAMEHLHAPANAKTRKTKYPFMFAVKTPNPRTLTESTIPVTAVNTKSAAGKLAAPCSASRGDNVIGRLLFSASK